MSTDEWMGIVMGYFIVGMFTMAFTTRENEGCGAIFVRFLFWPLLWVWGILLAIIEIARGFVQVFYSKGE